MRVSADKRDKGYKFGRDLKQVRVYLNDKLFTRAVTADEEEGYIVAFKLDKDGKFVIDEQKQSYVLEVLRGKVRIDILGADGGSLRTPKVKVERHMDGIHILVYSRVKANNIRRHICPTHIVSALSADQLRQACGVQAGAGAEHLCETYGDLFDPSEVARAGIEAFDQLLASERQAVRH